MGTYAPGRSIEALNIGPMEGSIFLIVDDAALTFQMYTTRTAPFLADTTEMSVADVCATASARSRQLCGRESESTAAVLRVSTACANGKINMQHS